jgi:class 3 adenylate cyclase
MDVGGWLRSLGLEQYEALFRASEIDADILPELTDADLEKLGVPLGHRKRLLKAISGLNAAETSAAPSPSTGATPHDAAERRQLTVMFCDLVGSTALSARFDPEELREEIRAYQNAVSGVVARYDGFVAKFMGDGVLAYFGYPRAHEDDAERAVRAGLEIVAAVARLETRATERLAVRIGIATGLVVVGDLVGEGSAQEQAVVGGTPNLAARLQALAQPGQIVLAGATCRLIGDLFRLRDLGRQTVKGFAVPVEAFVVEGVAVMESRFEAARRGLTDLVGRAPETALLRDRLRAAWAGAGQIVLLSGEAGIGKSRLGAQLAAEVASEPHTRLRYQCSPYHRDSVLHPFVVQLGRAARLAPEDPAETQLDKLEAILAPSRIAETAPLFASLLSIPSGDRYPPLALSAVQQRRLTFAALLDQLEALARQKPVLMLFEDIHWADATSLEVLDLTVERVRALPVLVLITFRPEYEAPWTELSHVTSIALDRLPPAEVETLTERVAGRPLPPEVTALHASCRSDGRGGEALSGTWLPGTSEGRTGQEARRILPSRHRHDQSACPSVEVRGRRRPPRTLERGVCEQGFCRGLCLEVPSAADDPGGEAAPGRAVGAASVKSEPCAKPLRVDIAALAGRRLIEDRDQLAALGIDEALVGGDPSGARPAALQPLVTPALADDGPDQQQARDRETQAYAERATDAHQQQAAGDHRRTEAKNGDAQQRATHHAEDLSGDALDHRRRPVGNDFAHRLADLGRIEAHHQHGVGAHHGGVAYQAIDGVAARLFEQLGVFVDLAADDRAQSGHDVAAETAASDDNAKALPLGLDDPVAGDGLGGYDQHSCLRSVVACAICGTLDANTFSSIA